MKYRIVEKTFSDGWTGYFIERQVFGFWCSETRAVSECSFARLCFNTLEQADEWIKREVKKEPSVLRKRVVG